MKSKRQWMATNRIKTREPFNKLFPIDKKTIDAIAEHMKINGYDESQPIVIWDQSSLEVKHALYIIDGHTRLLAAKKAGLSPVYIARTDFENDNAALQYAIHNQRDRRNLTDADILRCVEMLDKRKETQKDDAGKFTVGSLEPTGRTADRTASIIGTSPAKVKKTRTVIDHADDQTKQDILDGEKSIHKAYKETQEKRRKPTQKQDIGNPDFVALEKLHKSFLNDLVRFQVNHIDKKREWKKYLTEFHRWMSNLETLTQMWLDNLKPKTQDTHVYKIPEVTEAMHFATIALAHLESIRMDDPKREKALMKVSNWIQEQLKRN